MDFPIPTAEDHCRISILVRAIGPRSTATFNRLLERLSRVEAIQVSDEPKRTIIVNCVTQVHPELMRYGDLQAHRKIFGFIGIAQNSSNIQEASSLSMDSICEQYKKYKQDLHGGLIDSRCVLFGLNETETGIEPREVLSFNSLEESEEFENGVRELIRQIYFVLESRRIDRSFKKMKEPPCPLLPEEEKTRAGTENRQSKSYKKKCLGRLFKQVADYTLLTGLPSLALNAYSESIQYLKSVSDLLWLAAAYEGFACAAMAIKYNETAKLKPSHVIRSPTGRSMTPEEILEKFVLAMEHYERFSFASFIEYECMIRASSVYRHHRRYIEAEAFLREHVGKYLDDSFTLFDNHIKAHICMVYANIFKEMGFRRKNSFFSRLAVLFRLHVNDTDARTENDYRLVYPILYRSLPGYGVTDATKDVATNGPVAVQVKAVHEVYMSALRANFYDAAIRHLCYILQVYLPELDKGAAEKMLEELSKLVQSQSKTHSLAQHISLDQSGIILPPLQMTRFPTLSDFKIVRLAPQLAPRAISAEDESQKIFIYSPFQTETESNDIYWLTNCGCEVSVKVINPLPVDLTVKNLALLTEGCSFEAVPVKLTLTAYSPGLQPTEIKLLGMPRAPGKLTITGYSCEVLGVRNVCSIKEILPKSSAALEESQYTVEVLPELPLFFF